MTKRIIASLGCLVLAAGLSACASQSEGGLAGLAQSADAVDAVTGPLEGRYAVSDAAMATAVRGDDGKPVGLLAYANPGEAVRAGDMAAFIELVKLARQTEENAPGDFGAVVLAMDAMAEDDYAAARAAMETVEGEQQAERVVAFTNAWIEALEGDQAGAIDEIRRIGPAMPGLTGDLSLAAMLEGFDRNDEALAVYESLTPRVVVAPEHAFDPQGLVFAHAQTVIARRALLLRRIGRVEEAKDVYRKLAEAEPDEAVRYQVAIASLDDPDEFKDDEFLNPRTAFAQAFSDLSLTLFQQRIISAAMVGARLSGFDENRSTMDQLALLIDPSDDDLRSVVINGLYEEAFYEGAAHVALSAPEPEAAHMLAAASAYLMLKDERATRNALDRAIKLSDEDDELFTLTGALRLYTLLDEERRAINTAEKARKAAENPSEMALTHALTASALQHFGRADEAVFHAREARQIEDTHDRRMMLADILGEAGEVDEALRLIRTERLGRPNDPYMLNTLGYFLITRTDRYEEGYKILARAYALAERDPYIADSFGWARYKLGDLEGAKRLILQSKEELAPQNHWEIEDHLGDIHWHLGERVEAKAAWKTALEDRPPAAKRAKIEAKLKDGLKEPAPERVPLPDVSLEGGEVDQQDI